MYIFLDIVRGFSCKMCGACCRNAWQVTVDEESYERNRRLFERTHRYSEFQEAFMRLAGQPGEYAAIAKQPDGSCWFLGRDNLCRLHKEAGHAHLDLVCQTFPRYPMDTSRGEELTLSFCCPAVLELIDRNEPLQLMRSQEAPLLSMPTAFAGQVYPAQQPLHSPLRWYFEIEQHFMDLLQGRSLTLSERVSIVAATARELSGGLGEDPAKRLNQLFNRNYDRLEDARSSLAQSGPVASEILAEHFLVNFVFKKPFYRYGLVGGAQFLELFMRRLSEGWRGTADSTVKSAGTKRIIWELEFQFGHDRRALLGCLSADFDDMHKGGLA